ncbi:MAG: hypothetical protein QXO67_04105 [Candidatus Bathyarchaeia archaeon]
MKRQNFQLSGPLDDKRVEEEKARFQYLTFLALGLPEYVQRSFIHEFMNFAEQLLVEPLRAFERYDIAAWILGVFDQVFGPIQNLSALQRSLLEKAQGIEDWLSMRREEHPTWAPNVTSAVLEVLDKAVTVLEKALESSNSAACN